MLHATLCSNVTMYGRNNDLADNETQLEAKQNDKTNFGNKPVHSVSKPDTKQHQTSPQAHPDASKRVALTSMTGQVHAAQTDAKSKLPNKTLLNHML